MLGLSRWLRLTVVLLLAGGCTPTAGGSALERVSPEERAALLRVFAETGIDPTGVPVLDGLYQLWWRGAEAHAKERGRNDDAVALRRRRDDPRDAVAIEGGHVVGLRLGRTRAAKLGAVTALTHLVVLDIHDGALRDVEGVAALRELDHLGIAGNRITSLASVSRLPVLRSLYAGANPLERIDGLEDLPNLSVLNLGATPISRIEGLGKLKALRVLSLEQTSIARIEGLDENDRLEELNLSFCRIAKIENVGALHRLRYLNLWHNSISRLEGVEVLPSIVYLGLGENPYLHDDPANQAIFRSWGHHRLISTW